MSKLPCAQRHREPRPAATHKVPAAAAALMAMGLLWSNPAATAPIPADGDPVLFWADTLANSLLPAAPGSPPPFAPPLTTRAVAMVSVAVHDAVNASLGNPRNSYL
jgi:hypothetical protein